MTTFSNAFRSEVVRMARKELKPELQGMRKALAAHRSEIAAIKREVKTLRSQLKSAQRAVNAPAAPTSGRSSPTNKRGRKWVFKAEALIAKRTALGLTAKDMARLLEASPLSLSKWESGKVSPRAAQMARIRAVLGFGKRNALAMLSGDQ